jgi:hypothetical protein
VTYRNVSKEAFRLPEQPAAYNYWQLHLEKGNSSDKYTGKTSLPMGDRSPASPSAAIEPGGTLSVDVKFNHYKFAPGAWDRTKATDRLPFGKYKVSIEIGFPVKPQPDAKPTRIWTGDSILSNPVEIEVADKPRSTARP